MRWVLTIHSFLGGLIEYKGYNCFGNGNGGTNIEPRPTDIETLDDCEAQDCTGILFGYGECHLRKNIQINDCLKDPGFSLYLLKGNIL